MGREAEGAPGVRELPGVREVDYHSHGKRSSITKGHLIVQRTLSIYYIFIYWVDMYVL